MAGERTIFVDGYNVIRNTPALAHAERAGGLPAGREALLAQLAARYRHTPWRVVAVFDGDGAAESAQPWPSLSRGTVVFSCAGESADSVIARLSERACAAGGEVSVISDDLEVRESARQRGATPARVNDLRRRMEQGPRLLHKRFTHQQAVKRILAGDEEDRDEARRRREKGNPRRAPRKRDQSRWDPPI
ncbi:MAG TPA: NYN domain-containing protein [Ktedonobacterales bacterium]|jgi:predicted RNA-binding protein with PIN domain|nr:NYN domain-containing protein [Ktedonobacterales bacterium]